MDTENFDRGFEARLLEWNIKLGRELEADQLDYVLRSKEILDDYRLPIVTPARGGTLSEWSVAEGEYDLETRLSSLNSQLESVRHLAEVASRLSGRLLGADVLSVGRYLEENVPVAGQILREDIVLEILSRTGFLNETEAVVAVGVLDGTNKTDRVYDRTVNYVDGFAITESSGRTFMVGGFFDPNNNCVTVGFGELTLAKVLSDLFEGKLPTSVHQHELVHATQHNWEEGFNLRALEFYFNEQANADEGLKEVFEAQARLYGDCDLAYLTYEDGTSDFVKKMSNPLYNGDAKKAGYAFRTMRGLQVMGVSIYEISTLIRSANLHWDSRKGIYPELDKLKDEKMKQLGLNEEKLECLIECDRLERLVDRENVKIIVAKKLLSHFYPKHFALSS